MVFGWQENGGKNSNIKKCYGPLFAADVYFRQNCEKKKGDRSGHVGNWWLKFLTPCVYCNLFFLFFIDSESPSLCVWLMRKCTEREERKPW